MFSAVVQKHALWTKKHFVGDQNFHPYQLGPSSPPWESSSNLVEIAWQSSQTALTDHLDQCKSNILDSTFWWKGKWAKRVQTEITHVCLSRWSKSGKYFCWKGERLSTFCTPVANERNLVLFGHHMEVHARSKSECGFMNKFFGCCEILKNFGILKHSSYWKPITRNASAPSLQVGNCFTNK